MRLSWPKDLPENWNRWSKVQHMGERKRRLVPLVIQKVKMPAWMFGIVGIDFTNTNPVVSPLERLAKTLGKPLSSSEAVRGQHP